MIATASRFVHIAAQKVRTFALAFTGNKRGMVAVEFALIIPLMIMIYFGTVETTNAMTASRRVTNVAQTAADLTAQAASVSTSDINDIFAASAAILTPFPANAIKITITSVVANSSNATTVEWSKAYGTGATALSTGKSVTLPTGLTSANSSVVMVNVTYTYTSPIATYITGPIVMTETAYLKPRRSVSVAFSS